MCYHVNIKYSFDGDITGVGVALCRIFLIKLIKMVACLVYSMEQVK